VIQLPASVRVYLCLTACDMRKSFDGLYALVREHLELDAFTGHLFVFTSGHAGALVGSRVFGDGKVVPQDHGLSRPVCPQSDPGWIAASHPAGGGVR